MSSSQVPTGSSSEAQSRLPVSSDISPVQAAGDTAVKDSQNQDAADSEAVAHSSASELIVRSPSGDLATRAAAELTRAAAELVNPSELSGLAAAPASGTSAVDLPTPPDASSPRRSGKSPNLFTRSVSLPSSSGGPPNSSVSLERRPQRLSTDLTSLKPLVPAQGTASENWSETPSPPSVPSPPMLPPHSPLLGPHSPLLGPRRHQYAAAPQEQSESGRAKSLILNLAKPPTQDQEDRRPDSARDSTQHNTMQREHNTTQREHNTTLGAELRPVIDAQGSVEQRGHAPVRHSDPGPRPTSLTVPEPAEDALKLKVKQTMMTAAAFRMLSEQQVDSIVEVCSITKWYAHQVVARQRDEFPYFAIIITGKLKVSMNSRGTVGTLSAGKYFGDLYSETAKATVVTTEDSELVMVPLELIDAIRDGGEADAGNDEQLARLRFVPFQIGEGTFAEVFPCEMEGQPEMVAVKCIRKSTVVAKKMQHQVMLEIALLQQMQHPMVVKYITVLQDEKCLYVIQELCTGGDFMDYLIEQGSLSEMEARFYTANVVLAITHVHGCAVIYRDLKPENLVFTTDGFLKLVDFGFATKKSRCLTICGTPEYLAPEVVSGDGYGKGVDYWALGVLVYEMLFGCTPVGDNVRSVHEAHQRIMSQELTFPSEDKWSKDVIQFIRDLLTIDEKQRLGSENLPVMQHRWFRYPAMRWDALKAGDSTPPYVPDDMTLPLSHRVPYEDVHRSLLRVRSGPRWNPDTRAHQLSSTATLPRF